MMEQPKPTPIEELCAKTLEEAKAAADPGGQFMVVTELADGTVRTVARFLTELEAIRLFRLIHSDHCPAVWRRL